MSGAHRLPAVRRAPAKVNLGLAITGRRPDGYHELRSVFLRIGLSDRLEATVAKGAAADRLTVIGDDDCPVDGNIVLRALRLLRESVPAGAELPALELHLEKRVPTAAGLGGGSSDGAAALGLAANLWSIDLADHERNRLAALLGADVPFFAGSHPAALVTGVGNHLEPLPPVAGELCVLLVTPVERLSTAEVFAAFDRLGASSSSGYVVDELALTFQRGLDAPGLAAFADRLHDANDLWPAAVSLQPSLEGLRSELERALDRPFLLTGSGSTLFALYPSLQEAKEAGQRLAPASPGQLEGARVFAAGVDIHQDAGRIQ